MQDPKMMVLGLIKMGLAHGFEMEQFMQASNMRMWAKLGMSTIYKVLKDLEAQELVSVTQTPSAKGPSKKCYSITESGDALFQKLVNEALNSKKPVYSDRIPAIVFAPAGAKGQTQKSVQAAIASHAQSALDLRAEKQRTKGDPIASIVIEYYEAVYKAEREALKKLEKVF